MEQPPNLKPNSNSTSTSTSTSSNNSKPPKAKRIFISILIIFLPFLYVSILHVPPSTLFKDTTFWFLISNSIIIIVAAESGVFSSSDETTSDLFGEFTKHSRARSTSLALDRRAVVIIEKESSKELRSGRSSCLVLDRPASFTEKERLKEPKLSRSRSELAVEDHVDATKKLVCRRSLTEKRNCGVEETQYWKMSDEELNRRVEEFIRRFNREIRLQEMTR